MIAQLKKTAGEWTIVINAACVVTLIGYGVVGSYSLGEHMTEFRTVSEQTLAAQRELIEANERIARIEERVKAIAKGVDDLQGRFALNEGRRR